MAGASDQDQEMLPVFNVFVKASKCQHNNKDTNKVFKIEGNLSILSVFKKYHRNGQKNEGNVPENSSMASHLRQNASIRHTKKFLFLKKNILPK